MKNMSKTRKAWINAFWIVLSASSPAIIGEGYKWKQLLLSICTTCTLCMPFLTFFWSRPYQGHIPSDEHLLAIRGSLLYESETQGPNHPLIARIVDENGKSFILQDAMGLEQIREWERQTGAISIYAEGFLLCDGAGLFWPTYIITSDGKAIATRAEQKEKLEKSRAYIKQALFAYLLMMPFWMISLKHIHNVKKHIGA